MQIAYTGDGALLTIGTGPDHGMIDISINGWFWRSFNGYEERVGEKVIELPKVVKPDDEATGKVSIEVRSDNHHRSTDRVFRFKQIEVITVVSEDRHHVDAISYGYDGLNRLTQADGATDHTYAYDRSGNLTSKDGTTRTYNAANQLTAIGNRNLTYDANGNLTSDGTNTYTWDRANRLTQVGNTTYTYDGLGNRVSQTVNTTRTDYLLDLQAGLPKVLAATTGTNTERYIHAIRGLHATEDSNGTWTYALEDALGSVRGTIGSGRQFTTTHNYDPYGHPDTTITGFAFTGEPRDANGLQYHRARYYNPALAIFPSLDPYPGTIGRPMSLNGYAYVEGNVVNLTDPNGMQPILITPEEMQLIFEEAERLAIEIARGSGGVITEQILRQALRQVLTQYGHLTSSQLEGQAVQYLTSTAVVARFGAAGLITSALIPTTRDGRICNAYNRTITNNCLPDLSRYWALNYEPQYQIGWQPVDLGDSCLAPSPQTSPATSPYRTQTQVDTDTRRTEDDCDIDSGVYPDIPGVAESKLIRCVVGAGQTITNIRSQTLWSWGVDGHENDNETHQNRHGRLPPMAPPQEYREYSIYLMHRQSGGTLHPSGRTSARIVPAFPNSKVNSDQYIRGQMYYTPDHYGTFAHVEEGQ